MTPQTRLAGTPADQLAHSPFRATLVPANRFYAQRLAAFSEQVPFSRVAGQQAYPTSGANPKYPADPHTRFGQTSRTSDGASRWFDAPRSEARA